MAENDGALIRLSTAVTSIAPTDDCVQGGFNDGTSSQYDRVIGADGLHSTVRSLVFPDAPEPYFTGQTVWRAMIPRSPALADDMGMYYGRRNRPDATLFQTPTPTFSWLRTLGAPRGRQGREWPQLMRDQLSDYDGVIGWARERMTAPDRIDCRPLQVFLLPSRWYRG